MRYVFGEDPERDAEVVRRFQAVFDNDLGRWVIHFMLTDLGHFDTGLEGKEIALQDWSKHLLRLCGAWNDVATRRLVDRMFESALRPREPQGGESGQ